ncbi:VTT domain-containing protein [Enterococcus devriesei]|uniref:TVP38/TMEM64 family protein n=1 Tax=Enterococcus TaxID=1350 RepID=UPI001C0F79B6|nr:VTT domain-containing protein [Enterococcus devriesei]MBU5366491.1 VTT domain-containing protein [Enterococcus devriesei]MDT2823026.1 VTT domain-containing protein [Enterococcus devriesei]
MSVVQSRRLLNIISLIGIACSISLTIYFYHLGVFNDMNSLQQLVGNSPLAGPLIFILIQIIQVVIPIIPGGISLAAGVLIFGPYWGFLYNYIGICIGSLILFLLGRHYGKPLIQHLVSDKVYQKYNHWLDDQSRFEKMFTLAIFFPVAPDDALCLMASLTNISFKKYSAIIFLAKPASIFLYSLALLQGGSLLSHLLVH